MLAPKTMHGMIFELRSQDPLHTNAVRGAAVGLEVVLNVIPLHPLLLQQEKQLQPDKL